MATKNTKPENDKRTSIWLEFLFVMFSAPAALSVLAKLDERLDFRPILERIVLSFSEVSHTIWIYIGSIINVDLSFITNYLSFLALSFFPVLLSFRLSKNIEAFSYFKDSRRQEILLRQRADNEIAEQTEIIEHEFLGNHGIALRDWQARVTARRFLKEEARQRKDNDDPRSPDEIFNMFKKIIEDANLRRAEAGNSPVKVRPKDRVEVDGATASLKVQELSREINEKLRQDVNSVWKYIVIKFSIAVISCLALLYAFEILNFMVLSSIMVAVAAAIAVAATLAFAIMIVRIFTGGNTVFDYVAIPVIFVIFLFGIGVYDKILGYLSEFGIDLMQLLAVGLLACVSILMFMTVIAYRIFAYMNIFLWAVGIYVIDATSVLIIPGITQWLDINNIP